MRSPTEGLVVVSNREPYSHSYDGDDVAVDRPVGGLTAGLDPVMQRASGTWVAWGDGEADREVVDDDRVRVPPEDPSYTLRRVWLDDDEIEEYYYGYSNQVLWPLCHSDRGRITYEPRFWRRYREVNRRFAEAASEEADPGALVWFQDYHFGLAPEMVRRELGDAVTLAHFWHIPWPTWDDFRVCPQSEQLVEGLLANDLLGFHVDRFCAQFLEGVQACFPDAVVDWDSGVVHRGDSPTLVESFPMGVDAERIQRLASSDEAEAFWDSFCEERGIDDGATVAVGVDRLDYTKGIPERIRAIEYFLESSPEFRGEFVYVQKASESRSEIPAYREIQREVSATAERVNARFGTDDWQPVVSVTEMLPAEALYGLYRHADLALVSSVRDGMNLVAEEYVAAQLENEGALVLSDFAGVDETLGDYAYTINPYATEAFAETVHRTITDPPRERRERMRQMRQLVSAYDLDAWMDDIFETVAELREESAEFD
jgi:trehalose 6-phosphate synthase